MKLTFVCLCILFPSLNLLVVLSYQFHDILPLETSCLEHWPVSILTSLICKVSDLINSLISQFEFVRNKTWARLFVNRKVDLNFLF